jgi:hypothetical protein
MEEIKTSDFIPYLSLDIEKLRRGSSVIDFIVFRCGFYRERENEHEVLRGSMACPLRNVLESLRHRVDKIYTSGQLSRFQNAVKLIKKIFQQLLRTTKTWAEDSIPGITE